MAAGPASLCGGTTPPLGKARARSPLMQGKQAYKTMVHCILVWILQKGESHHRNSPLMIFSGRALSPVSFGPKNAWQHILYFQSKVSYFFNQDSGSTLVFGLDKNSDFTKVSAYNAQDLQRKAVECGG